MIADLPMYARPETRPALDAFWALVRDGLRRRGVAAPDGLAHAGGDWALLARGDVVLGEACNLPLRTALQGRVRMVGTSDHGLPGVPPGHYDSVFLSRPDGPSPEEAALGGLALAVNEGGSHSGWGAPQHWAGLRDLPTFRAGMVTGSHVASARAVAEGDAALTAVDRITWGMIQRWEPALAARLRERGRTPPSPGQTLVTAARDPRPHRAAVREALRCLPRLHAGTLTLRGLVALPSTAFDLPVPPPLDARLCARSNDCLDVRPDTGPAARRDAA